MMVHSVSDGVGDMHLKTDSVSSTNGQTENYKSVYKVGLPPRRNFVREFADAVKETLFADDPLRPYKDQPKSRKLLLGLQFLFPVLEWGRYYNLSKFKGDVIAGLTIASLCIPQKRKSLFWVPAIAPLISVVLSTLLVDLTRADKYVSAAFLLLQLVLANPGPVVIEKLYSAKFPELIGHDKVFLTVAEAVMTCTPKAREDV
ncbi:hypothetical protein B296_00036785 [Ensete ventricosum]|uniref:SLC26A/SulP transporter domain-containing protein n=1 Tax=Ensete ventricosum TaxID=4639 RepID=A0A426Z2Q4_ENSVE|nr:hypothetical protein B296_00036785 [Ensete ventricosum]